MEAEDEVCGFLGEAELVGEWVRVDSSSLVK